MRGLRTRSCKSTVFPTHIRNPSCVCFMKTFLGRVSKTRILNQAFGLSTSRRIRDLYIRTHNRSKGSNINGQVNSSNESRLPVPECGRASV